MPKGTALIARLYERVSTQEQAEEGFSLEAQKKANEAYCNIRSWTNTKHYTDAGFSGTNTNRPGLMQLMQDLQPGDVIVVYSISRLARS